MTTNNDAINYLTSRIRTLVTELDNAIDANAPWSVRLAIEEDMNRLQTERAELEAA